MTSLLTFLTAGCFSSTDTVLYEGTHDRLDFVVKSHETRTWNGSRTDWILKLEGHPELPVIIKKTMGNAD